MVLVAVSVLTALGKVHEPSLVGVFGAILGYVGKGLLTVKEEKET